MQFPVLGYVDLSSAEDNTICTYNSEMTDSFGVGWSGSYALSNSNPNNAYINAASPGLGCVVCDAYAAGDTFSLDNGTTWYTAVDRALLIQMRDAGADLSKVCVSLVTDMNTMFYNQITFNQAIGNWDVSNVTDMYRMFSGALAFDQAIGNWDVSSVTDMGFLFVNAFAFNQNIGSWDVGNVTDMRYMFYNASSFNQNIGNWDVSNVTNMSSMFRSALTFNQNIGSWDVSSVTHMLGMFRIASAFNQDLSGWCVTNILSYPLNLPVIAL